MTSSEYRAYVTRRLAKERSSAVPVGPLQGSVGKQSPIPALDSHPQGKRKGQSRVGRSSKPVARVHLIAFRHRILDSDNCQAGLKHLRDCVAASLGLDDSDKFIEWEYGQQQTRGEEGVIVMIERMP